ncbi:MAG: hydroxypyruvate isomerase family protein [Actinomycetes bacterium]
MPHDDLRYDVNLSILFTELPLLERPAAAAAAGFDAVELWWPFVDEPTPSDDALSALRRALDQAGTHLVGLNFDAGDMGAGWRGLLSHPAHSDRFRANIDVAVGLAETTGCRVLNALYGNRSDDVSAAEQDDLAVENLSRAAKAADGIGATVVVEALNSYESADYPLTSTRQALDVVDRVRAAAGLDNVAFLADLYHLHRMGEDIVDVVTTHADRIAHVQVADDPGRHQPGTGDIDFDEVLGALVSSGYTGYVGLEYKPQGPSAESFGWIPSLARTARA